MKLTPQKIFGLVIYALLIAAGVYLLFHLEATVWIIAAAIAAKGALMLVAFLSGKKRRYVWDLISGFVHLSVGLFMLFGTSDNKVAGLLTIETVIIIWLFLAGVLHIIGARKLRRLRLPWVWALLGGVVHLLLGVVCIVYPLLTGLALFGILGSIIGIGLVATGLIGAVVVLTTKDDEDEAAVAVEGEATVAVEGEAAVAVEVAVAVEDEDIG